MTERVRRSWARRFATAMVALLCIGTGIVAVGISYVTRAYDLSVETTRLRVRANGLVVDLDRDLARPYEASVEEAMYVELRDVPDVMRRAVLLSEDSWFYWRPTGMVVDPGGLFHAVASGFRRGGSTIPQQLAKNIYTGGERSAERKVTELFVAIWLDWHFSRDELLELYLNTPFMGRQVKGIEAAARTYYGTSFKAGARGRPITPEMAAALAVTIRDPNRGNPAEPRNAPRVRRLLAEMGEAAPTARSKAVLLRPAHNERRRHDPGRLHTLDSRFQYARDLAVAEAATRLGSDRVAALRDAGREDALRPRVDVVTTYRSDVQLYIERALAPYEPIFRRQGYDQIHAVVVDNRTGGIAGVVVPPVARFYPGSTVKPFVALCGLVRHGATEALRVEDTPVGAPPVGNADGRYLGSITLGEALARSRNPPFVRLIDRWSPACADDMLAALGTTYRLAGRTLRQKALGAEPADLMSVLQAYVAVATCGRVREAPYLVQEIRDRRTGSMLYRRAHEAAAPLGPEFVRGLDTLHEMLANVAARGGTADGSRFAGPALAAKSGTADGNRQVTLVTFTPSYTVLVSAGATDPRRIRQPLSSHALVPLVRKINANIHIGLPETPLGCSAAPLLSAALP